MHGLIELKIKIAQHVLDLYGTQNLSGTPSLDSLRAASARFLYEIIKETNVNDQQTPKSNTKV